jgi:hypothetical protein
MRICYDVSVTRSGLYDINTLIRREPDTRPLGGQGQGGLLCKELLMSKTVSKTRTDAQPALPSDRPPRPLLKHPPAPEPPVSSLTHLSPARSASQAAKPLQQSAQQPEPLDHRVARQQTLVVRHVFSHWWRHWWRPTSRAASWWVGRVVRDKCLGQLSLRLPAVVARDMSTHPERCARSTILAHSADAL